MLNDDDRTGQRCRPKKTWWDCVNEDMKSLGLFHEFSVRE